MYKKPMCKCGKPLVFWEEVMHTYHTRITKKGLIGGNRRIINKHDGALTRLHCETCERDYDYDEDKSGRLFVKGEAWNELSVTEPPKAKRKKRSKGPDLGEPLFLKEAKQKTAELRDFLMRREGLE